MSSGPIKAVDVYSDWARNASKDPAVWNDLDRKLIIQEGKAEDQEFIADMQLKQKEHQGRRPESR